MILRKQKTLPKPTAPTHCASHRRAVKILPQIHQRQERAQDPRLHVIRQRHSACRYSRQPLAVLGQKFHNLFQPLVRRVSHRRLASHLRATSLDGKRVVQHAEMLLGKRRRCRTLAASDLAARGHCLRGYDNATATLLDNITLQTKSSPLRFLVSHSAHSACPSRIRKWRLCRAGFLKPAALVCAAACAERTRGIAGDRPTPHLRFGDPRSRLRPRRPISSPAHSVQVFL